MFIFLSYSWIFRTKFKSLCKGTKKLSKKEWFFDFFCIFAQK